MLIRENIETTEYFKNRRLREIYTTIIVITLIKNIITFILPYIFQMSDNCDLSVYQTSFYYRGRLMDEDCEPPSNFTDRFLDSFTAGLIHPGWSIESQELIEHSCKAECALETFILMGRPYTKDIKEAVDW